ncbi:MmgE/PrpD family protein [Microvirga antarctica]|uniref:MmgE/PrpD family protein n=1 Tax=Microvirga antarctica TaxID=2819233 RepID=UPI001B312F53|nr:MmgE/PrpD family protein [Microvirga antarctica]
MMGNPGSTPARRLASAASATTWTTTPEAVRLQIRDLVIDTFAVIAAGSVHPSLRPAITRMTEDSGVCTVVGSSRPTTVNSAALANGAATTVLQLQDGHRIARGHPMSHVLPAAFAVAETIGASSAQLLSAIVAGYEVSARVGRALGGMQPLLHDTGTFGTIGAAVATAHLLSEGDVNALAEAIEGSAAVALFPYRDTPLAGATVHHLYVGLGASTGVTAGQAAVFGLTSLSGTLESFFGPRAGAGFDPSLLIDGLTPEDTWSSYECRQAYYKVHPTCAHLNGINDALVEIITQQRVDPDRVERVDVSSYGYALEYNTDKPENDLSARFSIPFAVAIALLTGPLDATSIRDDVLADPRVRALAARIRVKHDPDLDAGYPAGRPAVVTVTMTDGSTFSATAHFPKGDVSNPLTAQERRQKATQLFSHAFEPSAVPGLLAALDGLTTGGSVAEVGRLLRAACKDTIRDGGVIS